MTGAKPLTDPCATPAQSPTSPLAQTTGPKRYSGPIVKAQPSSSTPVSICRLCEADSTHLPLPFSATQDCARQVYRAGGIPGLWHGLGGTLLFRTNMGIMYGSYEGFLRINRSFANDSPYKLNDATAIFVAGGLGAK